MNVTATSYGEYNYAEKTASARKNGNTPNAAKASGDPVSISQAYREIVNQRQNINDMKPLQHPAIIRQHTKESKLGAGALQFTNRAWNGEQTAKEAATGYKYYLAPGRMDSETDASLAAETNSLGKRIDRALRNAGIELGEKDKLKFTVGKNGEIVVDGQGLTPANRGKTTDIQRAINADTSLAKTLYMNSASAVLHKADKAAAKTPGMAYFQIADNDPMAAAAQREAVDDWMRSTLGFGIEELEAENFGDIPTDNNTYIKKLADYQLDEMSFNESIQLTNTVVSIIKNGKKPEAQEFEASFTYQAGTLTDNRVKNEAQNDTTTTQSGEVAAKLNAALKTLKSGYSVAAEGTISSPDGISNDLAKLIEDAKDNGSYEKIVEKDRKQIAEYASKNGGNVDDYVMVHNNDGTSRIVAKNEQKPSAGDSIGAKDDTFKTAVNDFKSLFKNVLSLDKNAPFGLNVANGVFTLFNAGNLGNNMVNNTEKFLNTLNGLSKDDNSDIGKLANIITASASKKAVKINF